ncbi:glutathione peroxidase [Lacihabitans soyangensis]|uniref:Glutathione peroxidase n=1 Tax=Lacihabitans soyangensis TaxID=869394 RepID=A0AAE3H119_9BACT|nr:glutathione peroxidase [Lacihabitans soyangensis]MCP9762061.1 glutathione peroxidase [Lacihabitans soyangensis]
MKFLTIGIVTLAVMAFFSRNLIKNIFSKKQSILSSTNVNNYKGSFYDFIVNDLSGKPVNLKDFQGKTVVLINVASKCGFTPQYADWQKFHEKYGDKVAVLGFPANDFMSQEPGTSEEIAEFCQKNYGVTFRMFEKVTVTGKDKAPLYNWLTTKELNGWNNQEPTWNFCKYLINKEGKLTHFFESKITPENPEFLKAVGI